MHLLLIGLYEIHTEFSEDVRLLYWLYDVAKYEHIVCSMCLAMI